MTQDEFETLVKQYIKKGTILLIVAPGAEDWLNHSTRADLLSGAVAPETNLLARVLRATALGGNKLAVIPHLMPDIDSRLETEVDVSATVGFDADGHSGVPQLIIRKWRCLDPIPSPGVWPLTK